MTEPGGTNGVTWRLYSLERFKERVENMKLDATLSRVEGLDKDMARLVEEVAALRATIIRYAIGISLSVLGAAVLFALTVFRLVGS